MCRVFGAGAKAYKHCGNAEIGWTLKTVLCVDLDQRGDAGEPEITLLSLVHVKSRQVPLPVLITQTPWLDCAGGALRSPGTAVGERDGMVVAQCTPQCCKGRFRGTHARLCGGVILVPASP